MNKWNKRLVGAFVVMVLLLTSVPGITLAEDCAQSVWNLDQASGPTGGPTGEPIGTLLMEDAYDGSKTQSGSVTIGTGVTQTWVSDVAAASGNVSFSKGTWMVTLVSAGGNFLAGGFGVDIGRWKYDSDTDAHVFESFNTTRQIQITANLLSVTIDYTVDSRTLWEGERLALQVTNSTVGVVTLDTTGDYLSVTPGSSLATPCCPIGNFTPELTTGILLGIGLLGLGGFIFIKRKRGKGALEV